MDVIGVCIFVTLGVLIVSFICYSTITKRIIEGQEVEIEILKRDNERLKRALSGAKYVKHITVSNKPISSGYNKAVIEKEPANDPFKEW